jgi:Ethanolamine utilization protein EutJ (predicted chaperonin)
LAASLFHATIHAIICKDLKMRKVCTLWVSTSNICHATIHAIIYKDLKMKVCTPWVSKYLNPKQ